MVDRASIEVLVVEDHPTNQDVLRSQLEVLGLKSEVVDRAEDALSRLEEKPFDIVLCDCNLPTMSGFEFAECVRQLDIRRPNKAGASVRRLPIIAITAGGADVDRARCIDAGMDDILAKPIELEPMRRILMLWLGDGLELLELKDAAQQGAMGLIPSTEKPGEWLGLDFSRLDATLGHNPERLAAALSRLMAVTEATLGDLREAIAERSGRRAAMAAHGLRGSAGTAGAHELARIASHIENSLEAGSWQDVGRLMDELEIAHEDLQAAVATRQAQMA